MVHVVLLFGGACCIAVWWGLVYYCVTLRVVLLFGGRVVYYCLTLHVVLLFGGGVVYYCLTLHVLYYCLMIPIVPPTNCTSSQFI